MNSGNQRWNRCGTVACVALAVSALLAAQKLAAQQPDTDVATQTIPPGELQGVFGQHVQAKDGADAGKLWDILVDDDGKPRGVVIDYGGMLGVGHRKVAVAWQALQYVPTDHAHPIHLMLTLQQMGAIPEFKYDDGPMILGSGP